MANIYEPAGSVASTAPQIRGLNNAWVGRGWQPTVYKEADAKGQATAGYQTSWTSPVSQHNNSLGVAGQNNVYGALGAGAGTQQSYGTWGLARDMANNSPTAQLSDLRGQQAQHQAAVAQAAAMRNTNTPGGMDAWHNNAMQGLQQMQGRMMANSQYGQQLGASMMRNTNTPGGVDAWMQSMRGGR